MEYWGVLPSRSSLQFEFLSFVLCFDFFQHRGAEGHVGDALAGVVFVECDLLRFGSAFFFAGENLADLDQLFPRITPRSTGS